MTSMTHSDLRWRPLWAADHSRTCAGGKGHPDCRDLLSDESPGETTEGKKQAENEIQTSDPKPNPKIQRIHFDESSGYKRHRQTSPPQRELPGDVHGPIKQSGD